VDKPAPPTHHQQIEATVAKSQRMRVPFRNTFVQQGTGSQSVPGPLAKLVRHHDALALDLYLLIMLVAVNEPYDVVFPADAWARALAPNQAVSTVRVSRALARLEKLGLISKRRSGRMAAIRVLNEDGQGGDYTRPMGQDRWFQLPVEYWRDGWYRKLTFAAKVMLLIGLHRGPNFSLPAKKAAKWYGISADTIERGLKELEGHGLLENKWKWEVGFFAHGGVVKTYVRNLKAPFDRATRNRRRTSAQRKGVRMEVVK
jgi:DNA-binding transcriptional regulator YhcF (GntR family)